MVHIPFVSSQPTMITMDHPQWMPVAGGIRAKEGDGHKTKEVSIWSDGTTELTGLHTASFETAQHFPGWYAIGAVWLLYNAMRLRRHFGRVEVPLLVEAELVGSPDGEVQFSSGGHFADLVPASVFTVTTDRLELGRETTFDDIAQLMAEQISWACGMDIDFSYLRLGPNLELRR